MTVICKCGQSFANSGFRQHQRASDDPLCRGPPPPVACDDELAFNNRLEQLRDEFDSSTPEFNPEGDYYGEYADLSEDEAESSGRAEDEKDLEEDEWDSAHPSVAEEQGLEVERKWQPSVLTMEEDGDNIPMRLRGGAEIELQNLPYIVKYPNTRAGEVFSTVGKDMNTEYTACIGDHQANPYSPFKSQIDWELAYWAKTRGPSSTAFTELMQIDNVRSRQSFSDITACLSVAVNQVA